MSDNLSFDTYQQQAVMTDSFGGKPQPVTSQAFFAQLLGLVGETGEIAEKFKKIYRDKQGVWTPDNKVAMEKELGDVLWYISIISTYLDISLEDVASHNLEKLKSRLERDQIHGSGDNR